MPLITKWTTRNFHRTLYGGAGYLESVSLLKRDDDQQQGTVAAHTLYECRRSSITKTGEPIQHDMAEEHRTVWHIPRTELDRVGVNYIGVLDRIVQLEGVEAGSVWQPESDTLIEIKLFANHVHFIAKRTDPPPAEA